MPKTKPKKRPRVIMPDDLRRFALEVVTARQGKALTQVALADAVGISKKTMNNVERANNWTSVPVLIKLRRTLSGNDRSLLS